MLAIITKSLTLYATAPMESRDDPIAITPYRETRPYVGFHPERPVKDAGWRIEPPVSVANAHGERPAATAAAEPEDEPPGMRETSHGFFVGP